MNNHRTQRCTSMIDPAGQKVTVVGLGRFGGGIGVTRWLCAQGASVTISDHADAAALTDSIRVLDGFDVKMHLGGHEESDFLRADLLVVNPAVPEDMPLLSKANAAGIPSTTEVNLFLERCRAPVIGVTGTVGKSTTTAMTGEILQQRFTTHVGGNIGRSLLESLQEIAADHLVVLELSSFQLQELPQIAVSPHIAVVTNLSPNHLDRHITFDAYASAKKNIFAFQKPDDVLILNSACEATKDWAAQAPSRCEWFDPKAKPFELEIPGEHNQANAQAAWRVSKLLGVKRTVAARALKQFQGLRHRLQFVLERGGVRYYNDSKCTTPESAIVALGAFQKGKVILIAGGYDKGACFDDLGAALVREAKAVIALGTVKEKIAAAVESHRVSESPAIERATDLSQAVKLAERYATSGDVVLLSPGCASYDMFTNYEQRGDAFIKLIEHEGDQISSSAV